MNKKKQYRSENETTKCGVPAACAGQLAEGGLQVDRQGVGLGGGFKGRD